jgi:hypothetical protein
MTINFALASAILNSVNLWAPQYLTAAQVEAICNEAYSIIVDTAERAPTIDHDQIREVSRDLIFAAMA